MSYDLLEVPDGITPLVGVRGWRYESGRLLSCYRDVEWPVGQPLGSECIHPTNLNWSQSEKEWIGTTTKHGAPIKNCSCGIYALNEYPRGQGKTSKPWPANSVTGIILGWGHIILGTKGFRSQYAKPIAVINRPRSTKLAGIIDEVSEAYGLEIVDIKEMFNEHWRRNTERNYY